MVAFILWLEEGCCSAYDPRFLRTFLHAVQSALCDAAS